MHNARRYRRRHLIPAAVLAAAALSLTGCSGGDSTAAPSVDVSVPATVAGQVALVDAPTFAAASEQEGVVLLDVRTPAEFSEGHLEGAINISLESPSFTQEMAALDPAVTYAVYCRSGNRSATATQFMLQSGFAAPYELAGGIIAWQQAGLPVV